jgi:hypothetical protein
MPATSAGMTLERWFDLIGTRSSSVHGPAEAGNDVSFAT